MRLIADFLRMPVSSAARIGTLAGALTLALASAAAASDMKRLYGGLYPSLATSSGVYKLDPDRLKRMMKRTEAVRRRARRGGSRSQMRYDRFWRRVEAVAHRNGAPVDANLVLRLADKHGLSADAAEVDNALSIREIYGGDITAAAAAAGLPPELLMSVISVESHGEASAQSNKGAQGLMQLIPATAARYAVDDPFDPAANIRGGAAYLGHLMKMFDGDLIRAAAAYNAGEAAVIRFGGVPPYRETRGYVTKVVTLYHKTLGARSPAPISRPETLQRSDNDS